MRPHPQESEILQWAAEWSRYCAVLFYHTSQAGDSDIRVDFNEGEIKNREGGGGGWVAFEPLTDGTVYIHCVYLIFVE